MNASVDASLEPLRSEDDLRAPFVGAEKPDSAWAIGAEAEKFGVDRATGAPLLYHAPEGKSVPTVLHTLMERHGWEPEAETEAGPLIALRRGHASVTLEPGGQLELSGAPLPDVHAVCAESRGHFDELRSISEEMGVVWLGLGFHPFARQADLDWVPKMRYGIMREYLPKRGRFALDMMRRTATVQANYDYSSERDAMRKLRVSLKLSPVVTAMFANSPFVEGRPFGGRSYRARVWLDVDPDRQGLVPGVFGENSTYDDYIRWALDVPMFLFKRGGKAVENTGQTFRSFLRDGFEGHRPTMVDWETHLNTLFPEVRLKRTIEVRGADSLPAELACALPALWAGIFYDERALAEAEALVGDMTHDELVALRQQVPQLALESPFRGGRLVSLAERVVSIAEGGLERRARLSRDGHDERIHLARLKRLVERGACPADDLLARLKADAGPLTVQTLEAVHVAGGRPAAAHSSRWPAAVR
ncbi:MAG TPA: glutamate-cysteine ligase family protein [Polyangiaceae bacterium]|nr:glutamate-cysteine ligase family protein [Polyangiaceae bacterium]